MAIGRIGSGCSANIELFDIKYLCWLCHAIFEECWKTLDQIRSSTSFYFSTSVPVLFPTLSPSFALSLTTACFTFFPPPRIFNRGIPPPGMGSSPMCVCKVRSHVSIFNFHFVDFGHYSNVKMFRRVFYLRRDYNV